MGPLHDTYGAFLIGVVIAATLHGCICIQTWNYYTNYPSDRWWIKLLVAGVVLSETLNQAMITHGIYKYLVTYFGDPDEIMSVLFSPIAGILCTAFSTLCVQSFLTVRIYRLSQKDWFTTGLATIVAVAQVVITLVNAIKAFSVHTLEQLLTLRNLAISMNAVSASGDLVIALILCVLLQKSRTGFRRSDTMINRLILFSLNTGLLTSLCAVGSLICIVAWPHTFIYLTFYFSVGRLYCNSLLVALNIRQGLMGQFQCDISFVRGTQLEYVSKRPTLASSFGCVPNNISIKVDTTHECMHDEQYALSGNKDLEAV